MTRKALDAFDPNRLPCGRSKYFEVRNPKTGFGEHHCFYRNADGVLFFSVTKFKHFQEFLRILRNGSERVIVVESMIDHLKDIVKQTGNAQSGDMQFSTNYPIQLLTITVSPETNT